MTQRLLGAICAALVLGASPAFAQAPAQPPTAESPDNPAQAIPPSTDPCAARPSGAEGQTLSGQLADCGGVLTPPETGTSGIEAPVPAPDPARRPSFRRARCRTSPPTPADETGASSSRQGDRAPPGRGSEPDVLQETGGERQARDRGLARAGQPLQLFGGHAQRLALGLHPARHRIVAFAFVQCEDGEAAAFAGDLATGALQRQGLVVVARTKRHHRLFQPSDMERLGEGEGRPHRLVEGLAGFT